MAGLMDGPLLYQAGLQVNDDITIVSVLFARTSMANIASDTCKARQVLFFIRRISYTEAVHNG